MSQKPHPASSVSAHPDYDDVIAALQELKQATLRPEIVMLGQSAEGRPIPCVRFRNPSQDQQRALVVAGQHGSEESGRAIALALIRFLAAGDPEARALLAAQEIAVIPCGNPDGAQRNTTRNAVDIDTAHEFEFDTPVRSVESTCIGAFALEFCPEFYIDIHGLAGGSMNDRIWLTPVHGFSANVHFATQMAQEATLRAEQAGYPCCEVRPPVAIDPAKSRTRLLGEMLAYECNTLAFGLEAIEKYYREDDWCRAGLLRLKCLLAFANSDAFGLGVSGYPNHLVSGFRLNGLRAHGATPSSRRESRRALNRFLRDNFAIAGRGADGVDKMARVEVMSRTIHGPNPDRFTLSVRLRKPAKLLSVSWDGARLEPAADPGYRVVESAHDLQVLADIRAPFGGPSRFLEVRYDSPWL
jgi:hypothetical protein